MLTICRPVLDAIASNIFHIGPAGTGHAMKFIHNMILHSNFLANCKGLCMAERAGLDLEQAVSAGTADADFSWLFPAYEDLIDQLEAEA